ncbi:uncharacterized protein LOC132732356 [Ruditapes philippinarum]|uniref:uncharacterized protein LOC132732356 n=1 Tax=Ruditapes philippinarum TaxID=129788 RepID=UPI00295AD0F3|nr:uncharacterized protein LOC132732356 [Ruditapes philippinarum]
MSTQQHPGRQFVESRASPNKPKDYHRQKSLEIQDREKRESSAKTARSLDKSKLSSGKHTPEAVIPSIDQQKNRDNQLKRRTEQTTEKVKLKSYVDDKIQTGVSPTKRDLKDSLDTGVKSKKRPLVKQSTHGKFELKAGENVTEQDKSPPTIQVKNNEPISKPNQPKDTVKSHRTLPNTPFSIFRRKVSADEQPDETCYGSMQNSGPILSVQNKSDQPHEEIVTAKGEHILRINEKFAIPDFRSKTDLSRRQFFSRANSDTLSVHEFIPLRNIRAKQFPSHGTLNTREYEKRYKERIRLKDKSFSTEDRYSDRGYSGSRSDYPDGKKSVAFCSIHSSNSSYDGNDKTSIPGTENDFLKPLSKDVQNKQFLSPESVPMLEKSKSLQRLANQSSTETSGLGETVTSGLSSQESILSYYSGARTGVTEQASAHQDQGIDLREDTRNIRHEGNGTFGTRNIDSDNIINHTNELKKSYRDTYCVESIDKSVVSISVLDTEGKQIEKSHGASGITSSDGQKEIKGVKMTTKPLDPLGKRGYKPPLDFRSNDVKKPDNLPMFSANVGPDFDSLFTQSKNLKVPPAAVGIQIDQINNEWNKHKRSSSIKSRSSQGSFRSRSGSTRRSKRFLTQCESQWMKWGRERRQSFRRRMEQLEKPPEPEIPRASTPVKKARQEGLMFVHPDLGSKYISEDDINYIKRHKQERLKTCKLIEKSKTKLHHEAHDINRLTPDELMTLSRFWEHRVFVRTRYVSILLSLVTTVIYILSICSTQWVTYPSPGVMDHYAHEGLWFKCHPVQKNNHYTESCEDPTGRSWQNAVIGLMIFSAAFGFVAAILAMFGVCTSPLPKKIYYFHSAGEIFFVCALSTTVALIIYAVAISMDESIRSHTYGSGYGLGWGGTAFFFAASFCMSLDELVRESAQNKCCRYLCWRSRSNDRDNSQNV